MKDQTTADIARIISDVTATAQADAAYRSRYLADPKAVLREAGLEVPESVTVHVIEGTPANSAIPNATATDVYLVLPAAEEVLQDESLAIAAHASCKTTASTCFTIPSCASCVSSASSKSCH